MGWAVGDVAYSFNSQPPEGGWAVAKPTFRHIRVSTHSRPKAAGYRNGEMPKPDGWFQLTAARRRLVFGGM